MSTTVFAKLSFFSSAELNFAEKKELSKSSAGH